MHMIGVVLLEKDKDCQSSISAGDSDYPYQILK